MLLAVDTSTQWMSVALYDGEFVLGEMAWKTRYHHTVELADSIQNLLDRCGVSVHDLSVLAIALGPGSFTSLRIGLAHIKGMALALRIPVIGIPTLDILAAAQPRSEERLVAILQAGRTRLAYQYYGWDKKTGWKAETEPLLGTSLEMKAELTAPLVLVGELSAKDRKTLLEDSDGLTLRDPAESVRRAGYLAEAAWKRFQKGDVDDVSLLSPIYLHVSTPIPG